MVIGAAFIWAIANLHIKMMTGRLPPDRARDIDGFVLNGWIAALAAPQLPLPSLAFEAGQEGAMAAADRRGRSEAAPACGEGGGGWGRSGGGAEADKIKKN